MAVLTRAPPRVVVMTAQMDVCADEDGGYEHIFSMRVCMHGAPPPWPYWAGPV